MPPTNAYQRTPRILLPPQLRSPSVFIGGKRPYASRIEASVDINLGFMPGDEDELPLWIKLLGWALLMLGAYWMSQNSDTVVEWYYASLRLFGIETP